MARPHDRRDERAEHDQLETDSLEAEAAPTSLGDTETTGAADPGSGRREPDGRGRGRGRGRRGPRHGGPPPWADLDDERFADGRGRPGGRGRGRGGRARRGAVRNAVLTLLAEGPKHGYQIIQDLDERSDGAWHPSPGSVYPTLHRLAASGLVESAETDDGRRVFTLTADGRDLARVLAEAGDAPWTTIRRAEASEAGELRRVAAQLEAAVAQVAEVATPDQLGRATEVLAGCRRRLYALLAEEPASRPS